jgi:hypothetical protein
LGKQFFITFFFFFLSLSKCMMEKFDGNWDVQNISFFFFWGRGGGGGGEFFLAKNVEFYLSQNF